jgi:hypothetical protein
MAQRKTYENWPLASQNAIFVIWTSNKLHIWYNIVLSHVLPILFQITCPTSYTQPNCGHYHRTGIMYVVKLLCMYSDGMLTHRIFLAGKSATILHAIRNIRLLCFMRYRQLNSTESNRVLFYTCTTYVCNKMCLLCSMLRTSSCQHKNHISYTKMEPIDLRSDDEHTNELNGVEFDWKEAHSLSEIGRRTPILGDGNCGFRALFEGLQEKQLIKTKNEDGTNKNVFDLRKSMRKFAERNESTINADRVVGVCGEHFPISTKRI